MIGLLLHLAPRERVLLGVLVFVALPVAVALGLLLPLHERRLAAERAEAEAQALFEWVAMQAAEKQRLDARPGAVTVRPIGSSGIEQSLIAARLRQDVTELGARGEGVVEIRFDDVNFTDLAGWMSGQEAVWGYMIESFRIETLGTPARVAASLTLRPDG